MTINNPYSKYNSRIFNIIDPKFLNNDILKIITDLYNDIKNNKIRLLDQNNDLNNSLEILPNTINELIKFKDGDYEGFNKLRIYSVSNHPEELLDRIEEYYKYIYTQLKSIPTTDLDTFRKLNYLYFNFKQNNIDSLNSFFKYLVVFERDSNQLNSSSFITNILLYLKLNNLYKNKLSTILNNFIIKCFTTVDPTIEFNITEDELNLTDKNIFEGFSNFIDRDKNNMSLELTNFLINNIFGLNTPSVNFKESISSLITDNFINYIDEIFNNLYINKNYHQEIAQNTIINLCNYLLLNNISNKSDYITIRDESYIIYDERTIFNKLTELIFNKEKSNLLSFEYTAYQFKNDPLFFLNSYFITYNNYLNDRLGTNNDILNDMTFVNEENISDWLNLIDIDLNKFNNLEINLGSELLNSKALEYSFNLYFIKIISKLVDSDEFHDLIINNLINVFHLKSNYIIDYKKSILDNIYKIKTFIKIYLVKKLIDKNLFNELLTEFNLIFNSLQFEFNEVNNFSLNNISINDDTIEYIRGIFYTANVVNILTNILNSYRF
jgi:hypothetical protein